MMVLKLDTTGLLQVYYRFIASLDKFDQDRALVFASVSSQEFKKNFDGYGMLHLHIAKKSGRLAKLPLREQEQWRISQAVKGS